MFASIVEVPNVSKAELNATIKYSAENYVPMKSDESNRLGGDRRIASRQG